MGEMLLLLPSLSLHPSSLSLSLLLSLPLSLSLLLSLPLSLSLLPLSLPPAVPPSLSLPPAVPPPSSLQPTLTGANRTVTHDVPVAVVPERLWPDYQEPDMPDIDVRMCVCVGGDRARG